MLKNLKSRPLWVHILVGLGLAFILILIILKSLDWITRHGTTRTIPSVLGKTYDEAVTFLEDQGFDVMIQDSIYSDTAKPMMVLRQFPEADATVKRNRTVYLTINRAIPPLIELPPLEGMTYRAAELALKQYGLYLEDTVYRTDAARNQVLEVQLDNKRIKPGEKIHMGSMVLLVLGSGVGDEEFRVPDLFGRTFGEAKAYLEAIGLTLGSVLPAELGGNPNAFISGQRPEVLTADGRPNTIRQGQMIDLFLQVEKPVRPDSTGGTPAGDYQ